ncbi:MAG: DMP19 family protein [Acutalibacteraceae bacterium]
MFKLFKRKKEKEQMIEESNRHFNEVWNADFDKIWSFADENDLVTGMYSFLCRKSDCGENPDVFTNSERVFFVCHEVMDEVNNGGFSQYFFNSSGNFATECEAALREIGANKSADICRKAVNCFDCPLPVDRSEREDFLIEAETEEISEILYGCDLKFYACEDDIESLLYQYVLDNKDSFRR